MLFRATLLALVPLVVQSPGPGHPILFRNASVIDVETGTIRRDMTVEVSADRITRVQENGGAEARNATVVDATGKYLIPGLWDSHVHLTKLGESSLAAFVANGVTSVRDMGSDLAEVQQWRRDIEAGRRPGPRIRTSGPVLESRANVARMKREQTVEPVDRIRLPVGTPAEADAAVARLADAGADFLKVRTVADAQTFTAIASAARARGLKLTGHPVARPAGLIEAGMASVEHLLAFPPLAMPADQRRALFERLRAAGLRIGTTTVNVENSILVPYETALERLRNDPHRRYVRSYLAADWAEQVEEKKGPDGVRAIEMYARALPGLLRDFREMHAAGVQFLAGSDAAVVFVYPGFSLHGELESLVRHVGLSPVDALRAATLHPAAFFGLERELGAIRVGHRADLVLLDANPLQDIRHTQRIAGVVRRGTWFDRAALAELLERAAREAGH